MRTYFNRRQLLVGAGMGAIGTAVAAGVVPATVFAADEKDAVEGGWYIKVHAVGLPDFDALYSFAKGGVFTRIDGRNNAPAVGTWRHTHDHEFVFSFILFNSLVLPAPPPGMARSSASWPPVWMAT